MYGKCVTKTQAQGGELKCVVSRAGNSNFSQSEIQAKNYSTPADPHCFF